MDQNTVRPRLLAILASPASDRREAERRLAKVYRRAKREIPTDLRSIALAVALHDVSDDVFAREMFAAEEQGWVRDLPPPSFVQLRLSWDKTMDGDYGVREVKGWDPERVQLVQSVVRERSRGPISNAILKLWEFDRRRAALIGPLSPACDFAPPLMFGPAPKSRLAPIREDEPYFLNSDGLAVGAYNAWYVLESSAVVQYENGLLSWLRREWPEALELLQEEEPLENHPFSAWVMRRSAEALVRRLTFEEATIMMMNDQLLEDKAWM